MDVTYKVPENNVILLTLLKKWKYINNILKWSAIHIVCISDSPSIKILETLLKDERVDINLQDSKGVSYTILEKILNAIFICFKENAISTCM